MKRLIVAAVVLIAILAPAGASASCIAQPEAGRWINTDAATRSIPRIELRFICQDQVINGELYPPGPPWYVHVWGKCHPTNCDWGEVGATRTGAGHVYAFYDQGFAKRYVYAKMSAYRPGQLWVYTWTHFTDGSGRADYATNNWFRRE
jgi:hypothetical protein